MSAETKEYLIGTGGWAYFKVPGLRSLNAYSRAFNFVEVNSTFYQIPPLKQVENWKRQVPSEFTFAVRANRSITHTWKFQPNSQALEAMGKMKEICELLRANILHMATPASFKFDSSATRDLRDIVSSSGFRATRVALEVRGEPRLPDALLKTMTDLNIVHSTDISNGELPAYKSDVVYSRLFGRAEHNKYQPTDGELVEIDAKASGLNAQHVAMSFHFVRMYTDAARLKIYKQTGKFPKITGSTGLESLKEVLAEDAKMPATKANLMATQGWKLFDLTMDKRARANDFLEKLPDKTYSSVNEVVSVLNSLAR